MCVPLEKIENFGYSKQKQFIQNHPSIAEQIKEKSEKNKKSEKNSDKIHKNKNVVLYYQKFLKLNTKK